MGLPPHKQKEKFVRNVRQLVYGLVPPYGLRLFGTALRKMNLREKPKLWSYTNSSLARRNLEIGDYTYGIPKLVGGGARLKIGRFCSIADEVVVFLGFGNHRTD